MAAPVLARRFDSATREIPIGAKPSIDSAEESKRRRFQELRCAFFSSSWPCRNIRSVTSQLRQASVTDTP